MRCPSPVVLIASTAALLALTACSANEPNARTTSQPAADGAVPRTEALGELLGAADYELIADGVHQGPAIRVEDVIAAPDQFAGKAALRVEGEIVDVCQNKGCWMTIGSAEQSVFVKFAAGCDKYVPRDAAGRSALVEGKLIVEEVSVEERRHLLEDKGLTAEAAAVTEPSRELRLVATGAAIRR